MRGFVSIRSAMTSSVLVTMRTLHETLHPHSRPHYYRSCRCRLLHAGRQHAQSCVDENEPWSAIGLHVGMVAAGPSQEELQFCLAAAQHALRRRSFGQREREKHTVSVRTVFKLSRSRRVAENTCAIWSVYRRRWRDAGTDL